MQAFPGARPARIRPVTVAGLVAVGFLALAVACGRAPAPSELDEPAEEPKATEPPAAEPAPAEPEAVEPEAVEPEPAVVAQPETPPANVAPPAPVAVENPVPVEETQEIVVELDETQRASLAADAERDLRLAVDAVRDAQLRSLSAEQQETLATVEGLVAAARDALAADDIQAAANLANKAKLLSAELAAE
jgi:hypothetical protein